MDDPRKEDELRLDEESVSDLDVPEEDAAGVRGGRDDVVRQEGPPPDGGVPEPTAPPWMPAGAPPQPGGSQTGTGCRKGKTIRSGCAN